MRAVWGCRALGVVMLAACARMPDWKWASGALVGGVLWFVVGQLEKARARR